MVTVLVWSSATINHHSLPNGTSITAALYCVELDTIREKLTNVVVPVARTGQRSTLNLRHPLNSPDFATADFYFLQNLEEFVVGKK